MRDMECERESLRLRVVDLARRRVLALMGTGMALALAGCGEAAGGKPVSVSSPTVRTPASPEVVTSANGSKLKQVDVFDIRQGTIRGVAWSPDSRMLAVTPYKTVQVYEVAGHKLLAAMTGHSGQINGLAWSHDGKILVSVSDDYTVRLWDTASWNSQATFSLRPPDGSPMVVLSVAWAPDSRRLVAGTYDGAIHVWDAREKKSIAILERPGVTKSGLGRYDFAVWGVAWSPDGKRIASNRYDSRTFIWDMQTQAFVRQLGSDAPPNGVAWSPDGQTLAVSTDMGDVQLWDNSGKLLATLDGHPDDDWCYPIMWSPDGSLLAGGRKSGLVQLWGVRGGKELAALKEHNNHIWGGSWSPDGKLFATGSDDETVRLWGVI